MPERVISLNGTLSLAFGKGGQKFSSAHYNAATRTLALAKNAGGGALAHEWFHAFDHYIAEHIFNQEIGGRFASTAWLTDFELRSHPLCQQLARCYRIILLNDTGDGPSEFVERAMAQDKREGSLYWSKPEELCARAFESYIEDAGISNQFLAYGTRKASEGFDPYPRGDQRALINQNLGEYFAALGASLSASRGGRGSA